MARESLTALYLGTLPVTPNNRNQLATKLAEHDTALDVIDSFHVTTFGAVGDGVTDDYAAIALALTAAEAAGAGIHFPASATDYVFGTPIVIDWDRASITADPGVRLKFTGTGKAISFDGGAGTGSLNGVRLGPVEIVGTATCTQLLHARACHRSKFDARLRDCASDGLLIEHCVGSEFNVVMSVNEGAFVTTPTYGARVTRRGVGEGSAAIEMNVVIEGLSQSGGTGVYLDWCDRITVNGISEGNDIGIATTANGGQHVINLWMESNTTADVRCNSFYCVFDNCKSEGDFVFQSASYGNTLRDGTYGDVTNESTYQQRYEGCILFGDLIDRVTGSPLMAWNQAQPAWCTARATGLITCVAKASLVDGEYLTIGDGISAAVVYEWDVTGNGATGGRVRVDVSLGATATEMAAALAANIAVQQPRLDVVANGDGTITLRHKRVGTVGNVTITENVANAGFLVTGMSGGA